MIELAGLVPGEVRKVIPVEQGLRHGILQFVYIFFRNRQKGYSSRTRIKTLAAFDYTLQQGVCQKGYSSRTRIKTLYTLEYRENLTKVRKVIPVEQGLRLTLGLGFLIL